MSGFTLPPIPEHPSMTAPGLSVKEDMDEQTKQARFESMRKNPGMRKASSNKKLFIVHKDLQKQCVKNIQRHEFDTRIATSEILRQQNVMERKQEKLKKQRKRIEAKREQTHILLERLRTSHNVREQGLIDVRNQDTKPKYMELIRAIGNLSMPRSMKERLRWECTVNPIRE